MDLAYPVAVAPVSRLIALNHRDKELTAAVMRFLFNTPPPPLRFNLYVLRDIVLMTRGNVMIM